ncbi:MAG TPA: CopG family transcriptional regulator [Microcoleaceae bacterium UBA11344]|nr:CopG family transcriptional regulator [Microcoleaceae cyanobacterium UBA11344]
MSEKQLSIRLPEHEMKILERNAKIAKRTKTDVIREFIRTLSQKPS